jgi:hypothetical protein
MQMRGQRKIAFSEAKIGLAKINESKIAFVNGYEGKVHHVKLVKEKFPLPI